MNPDSDSEPSASANSPDSAEEQTIIDSTIVYGNNNNTVRTANMTLEEGDEVTQTQAVTQSVTQSVIYKC